MGKAEEGIGAHRRTCESPNVGKVCRNRVVTVGVVVETVVETVVIL